MMKKILSFIVTVLICSGCATVDPVDDKSFHAYDIDENALSEAMIKLGNDYLKADEFNDETMREAGREFKYDILGANKPIIDKKQAKAAILKAKETLLASEYKADYIMRSAKIDKEFGMPETRTYIFVHFKPVKDNREISETTYLVVVNRFYDQVFCSGVYSESTGDPFYRYVDVLKEIRK